MLISFSGRNPNNTGTQNAFDSLSGDPGGQRWHNLRAFLKSYIDVSNDTKWCMTSLSESLDGGNESERHFWICAQPSFSVGWVPPQHNDHVFKTRVIGLWRWRGGLCFYPADVYFVSFNLRVQDMNRIKISGDFTRWDYVDLVSDSADFTSLLIWYCFQLHVHGASLEVAVPHGSLSKLNVKLLSVTDRQCSYLGLVSHILLCVSAPYLSVNIRTLASATYIMLK